MEKCRCCSQSVSPGYILKDGTKICEECFRCIPVCAGEKISTFTYEQFCMVKSLFRKADDGESVWLTHKWLGLSDHSIIFSSNRLRISLAELESIELKIVDEEVDEVTETMTCHLMLEIITKNPRMRLREDLIGSRIEIRCKRKGNAFSYNYPREITQIVGNIQKVLDDGTYDLSGYRIRRSASKKDSSSRSSSSVGSSSYQSSSLKEAMKLYELKDGFSQEELKKKYRGMMRKYHPDVNLGFEEAAKEKSQQYQEAYKILEEYLTHNI